MAYLFAIIAVTMLITGVIGSDDNDRHFVGLICWTCYNKSNNKRCNDWAPNLSCPPTQNVCKTVNRLSARGDSLLVNKMCVRLDQCTMQHVGCRSVSYSTDTIECTSCCDFQYCNEQVPLNETDAFRLSAITENATCRTTPSLLRDVIVICWVVMAAVAGPLGVVT